MHNAQIQLIKDSWSKIMPIADETGQLFYQRLFEIDPDLKQLFEGDTDEQINKLMSTLNLAILSLDDINSIITTVQELGIRHGEYGVLSAHYSTVGEAFIWTLEKKLGEDFTEELKQAWIEVYTTLSNIMIEASNTH